MFSNGYLSSSSLATVTPSWVMVGAPNFLSSATLRPRGPSVVLTASATRSTPRLSARRASSLNRICFAILLKNPPQYQWNVITFERLVLDNPQNIFLGQNQVLDIVELVLGAAVLGKQ